jgi:hypothetical protein
LDCMIASPLRQLFAIALGLAFVDNHLHCFQSDCSHVSRVHPCFVPV